jgi:hypothetical protein
MNDTSRRTVLALVARAAVGPTTSAPFLSPRKTVGTNDLADSVSQHSRWMCPLLKHLRRLRARKQHLRRAEPKRRGQLAPANIVFSELQQQHQQFQSFSEHAVENSKGFIADLSLAASPGLLVI